ncbi:MAG: DUF365 domain-containing protein [Candidatus Bathyarchaeota archaeon]|nr:DUF365 domain-containing protein [Candidatus Bathyarchaeota archaeon]
MSGEVAGIIFPVPKHLVDRLLVEKRNVFVKYVARNGLLRLSIKHRVLFYASEASKEIVGEGTIEEISLLTPTEVLQKYGRQVFLNETELEEYIHLQPNRDSSKKMLVLVLSKLRRYAKPKFFERPISMSGIYLTKENYRELLKTN